MTLKHISLLSFLITMLVWAWFSWPLPRYVTQGVPAAAHLGPAEVRPLIPGDHLQFMYYCWLAGDMAAGKTPLFCNLYEFNTGKEKEGYRPDAYYFPFSLIYAVSAYFGGRALGWNLTGFLTLWLTYLLTWLLVRRYTSPNWLAGCAALITIILPFRWINLCGGSPAGWACVWIPAIFLGIDLAVREGKISGGFLTGFAILFASWTDNHIFFFGTLAVPFWTLIAITAGPFESTSPRRYWGRIIIALLPVSIMLGLAFAFPILMQVLAGPPDGRHLGAGVDARTWREVALYSPVPRGFLEWFSTGVSSHIYIGISLAVFLTAGLAGLVVNVFRDWRGNWRYLLIMLFLATAIFGVTDLALGTNGLFHAVLLRICRKLIPPYAMIRQPAKIFCLMPVFLAVAAGLGLNAVFAQLKNRGAKILVALLFCGTISAEYALRVNPVISVLDNRQGAYEAVANDAFSMGKAPHALIVPLWPGDSHYSSAYQYYASLYRVRMVNGYNPFVSKTYFENVFRRYESVNQGCLSDEQLDELQRRNIDYIMLHEDLFPEKVSPFPVGWTLKHFLENKRLQLLKQDGRVWAFKILPAPDEKDSAAGGRCPTLTSSHSVGRVRLRSAATQAGVETSAWHPFGSARHWQAEESAKGSAKIIRDNSPCHASYAVLDSAGSQLVIPALRVAPVPNMGWMLRARGEGSLLAETAADGTTVAIALPDISTVDWQWFFIPIENFHSFAPLSLKLEWLDGSIDCDQLLLASAEWIPPAIGQTVILSAPGFFHAGYTDLKEEAVVLEKGREPVDLIFYGPKLPLEKGRYRIELEFCSETPKGTLLGQFNVKRHDRDAILNWIPIVAGSPSFTEFTQTQNVPMYLEFRFLGNGSMKIKNVILTRRE